jgi:hypothetical protein
MSGGRESPKTGISNRILIFTKAYFRKPFISISKPNRGAEACSDP